jgi:predicted phosphohydrolase
MSDLHGRLPEAHTLPTGDLFAFAGDNCPDAPGWDAEAYAKWQTEWLATEWAAWERTWDGLGASTWGNHDWVSKFPANCKTKAYIDELLVVQGKRIWFTPWVSPCGGWNYQKNPYDRNQAFLQMPEGLDLLVMHGPAYGVGDQTYGNVNAGCTAMREVIREKKPKHVIFGHIHEGQRFGRAFSLGESLCYNVAMWGANWQPLVIEL